MVAEQNSSLVWVGCWLFSIALSNLKKINYTNKVGTDLLSGMPGFTGITIRYTYVGGVFLRFLTLHLVCLEEIAILSAM